MEFDVHLWMDRRDRPSRTGMYKPGIFNLCSSLCGFPIAVLSELLSHFAVHRLVARLPGTQAVNVAVVHTERRSDEHRVVNLDVRGSMSLCVGDIIGGNALAVLLDLARDGQQRLQLRR